MTMANEITGKNFDFKYGLHDASADSALKKLNSSKADGVSAEELAAAFEEIADYGQLTQTEARQLLDWGRENFDRLSPEAKKVLEKIDSALQDAGFKNKGLDFQNGQIVLGGPQLEALRGEINKITGGTGRGGGAGQPDGVDRPPSHHGDQPTYDPPRPPSTGGTQGPSGGSGASMSWREIFALLLQAVSDKEKEVKEKGKIAADATKGGKDSGKKELGEFQQAMQELNEMFSMVTNLMKSLHDTANVGIRNLTV
jgi:hypothetical protein